MKIISWNVNGLRASYKRNFIDDFHKINADIFCIQETKANINQLPEDLVNIGGYNSYFNSATRKGYSGVAIYSKLKPIGQDFKIGIKEFDQEGRFIRLDFEDFSIINVYVPNGGRDKSRLEYKLAFYEYFLNYLRDIKDGKVIVAGDFNVAHREIDLARPKQNKNNIMFTHEERKQIDDLIKEGYIDSFRIFNKEAGNYSWWAYYRNLRERNIGWRIDYAFISKPLENNIKNSFILKSVMGSDHCPVGILL